MKIRVISDIHCDINGFKNTTFKFREDFVICCGDISGDRFSTEFWINRNIKQGIIIGGNHLGYQEVTKDKQDSFNLSIKYLQNKFKDKIYFLENQNIIIDDVIFVGCVLFTDFKLYNQQAYCELIARQSLNDFRYVKLYKNGELVRMQTSDQIRMYNKSKKYIEKICKENPDKKVIVITHYAPSINSIAKEYKEDYLSAAFASNLEDIISKYNNLKLWCHGHIHNCVDYELCGTRIIANPLGYEGENPAFNKEGIIIETNDL